MDVDYKGLLLDQGHGWEERKGQDAYAGCKDLCQAQGAGYMDHSQGVGYKGHGQVLVEGDGMGLCVLLGGCVEGRVGMMS